MAGPTALTPATSGKPRRRPLRLVAGLLGMLLTALGAWVLVNQLQEQQDVVVVRESVARGQVISQTSLGTLTTSRLPGVSVIPSSRLREIVGKRAGADLTAGTLLSDAQLSNAPMPPTGQVLVGTRLAAGRVPASELEAGSRVRLVATNPDNADPQFRDPYTGKVFEAQIVTVRPSVDGQTTLVDVTTAQTTADDVSILSAAGRLTLIKVGP